MKELKKVFAIVLTMIIVTSTIPVSAMEPLQTNEDTLYNEMMTKGELVEIDYEKIPTQIDLPITSSTNAMVDKSDILNALSLTSQEITSYYNIDGYYNTDAEFEMTFDDGSNVTYDENMNITSFSNFNSEYSKSNFSSSSNQTLIINELKNEYEIDDTYELNTNNDDNGDVLYSWEKVDENGNINIYDSLSIRVDKTTNSIVAFNRFNDYANTVETTITESSAKNMILNYNCNIVSCTKEYIKPNFFWNAQGIAYEEVDEVRLSYIITLDNGYVFYVDAITGEIIGGDILKAINNSGIYAYNGFEYSTQSRDLAKTYLSKLGYNNSSTLVGNGGLRSKVYDYVRNDKSAYGFYIDCHGSTTSLATDDSTILRSSEVIGNWHFVFLDACLTGANSNWANAFNINSNYSKRAFLGWSDTVGITSAYSFCKVFWPETVAQKHSSNIRDAAVWAAAQIPGSGTTPIKFYGDRSYNGKAY